jgi:hypothetical protein
MFSSTLCWCLGFIFMCFPNSHLVAPLPFELSTISSKRFRRLGFTHCDSFNRHPYHLTKYYLPICLVYFAIKMHYNSLQFYAQWSWIRGDRLVSNPSFFCPHELISIWTHGRSSGLPMSLGVTNCRHQGGVYEWSYKDLHTLGQTHLPKFQAS